MPKAMNTAHFDRILVVDDATANLQLLTNLLTGHGYTVYPASDGELALEFVRSMLPDLILLDIRMPGMDGYEVCRRLKAEERTRSIPIIFISILEDERDKVKGFQAGAVDYITKPFQPEEVLARVRIHLRLRELTEHLEHTVAERTEELHTANAQLQLELAERKQAETALNREHTLLANIMETSPIGITTVDGNGRITFANTQAVNILGLTKDEIAQRTYNAPDWRITDFAGDPFPDEKLPFQQVMTTRQPVYDVQHAIVWPDGRRVFLSINGAPILDESGQVESVVFALQDITERKWAEEVLRISEGRYRMAQAIGHVGNWEYNLQTTEFWGSDEAKRIYGFDPDQPDFSTDEVENCIPERERVHQALVDLIETGKLYNLEFEIHPINSSEPKIITSIAELQRDKHDDPLVVVGVIQDVTTRKRAEAALRQSEALLNATQRLAKVGGWDWDVERQTTFWTEETYRIHGLEPQASAPGSAEYIDRSLTCYDPADRPIVLAAFQRCGQQGEAYDLEFPFTAADGCRKWVRTTAAAVREDGRMIKVVGTIMDITERKQAEEEIRTLNQALEQRVVERTAQLEAANKELETFAYSVSHNLRAPLRHIDGFLELLQQRTAAALDEQSRHYLTTAADEARRMGLLIDDLLSFSRMGRSDMATRPVNLANLVREAIRELEPETRGRTIHWQIADLPVVTGDRAMLRVALVNLIANAVKFTQPCERADIEIGCQCHDTETIIFVRDNGVGFDPNYADKLFGVFQRLHRADEFEGTGIGLANVRRIIQRHGGRTWAEGKINQGAAFYFSLPHRTQGIVNDMNDTRAA